MIKNIIVCLDGSTMAEQILPFVKDQAKGLGAKLTLLQVIGGTTQVLSTASLEAGMMVSPTGADIALSLEQMNAIKDDVQHYLDGHVEELKRDGIEAEGVIVNGKAGPAIIDYSVANGADMIAIVTHGRSGIGKAVYGSVADYVLKNSGIPTLVFKPKDN